VALPHAFGAKPERRGVCLQAWVIAMARSEVSRWCGLAAALSLFALAACGGRTEGGFGDLDTPPVALDPGQGNDDPGSIDGNNGAGGNKGSRGGLWGNKTPLEPCVLGIEQWRVTECDYYAEGRCYATKLAACACVCPPDSQNSVCLSSFDVPSRVTCL
jgi:hypothetical protein